MMVLTERLNQRSAHGWNYRIRVGHTYVGSAKERSEVVHNPPSVSKSCSSKLVLEFSFFFCVFPDTRRALYNKRSVGSQKPARRYTVGLKRAVTYGVSKKTILSSRLGAVSCTLQKGKTPTNECAVIWH